MSKKAGSTNDVMDRHQSQMISYPMIGIVTANSDDTGAPRVKVRLPSLEGGGAGDAQEYSTGWVRVASFTAGHYVGDDAGPGPRGAMFHPEIGDEVIVVFEMGDVHRPIIVGRLWSDVSPDKQSAGGDDGKPNLPVYSTGSTKGRLAAPADGPTDSSSPTNTKTKHEKGKNDLSGIVSRLAHTLLFNDNKDEPAIYLHSSKKHRIELIDAGMKGILICDADDNYVWLHSGSAGGDIEIKTKGNITLDSQKDIKITAKGNIVLTSQQDTKINATGNFNGNGQAGMKLHTDASGEVSASNTLTLTGGFININ